VFGASGLRVRADAGPRPGSPSRNRGFPLVGRFVYLVKRNPPTALRADDKTIMSGYGILSGFRGEKREETWHAKTHGGVRETRPRDKRKKTQSRSEAGSQGLPGEKKADRRRRPEQDRGAPAPGPWLWGSRRRVPAPAFVIPGRAQGRNPCLRRSAGIVRGDFSRRRFHRSWPVGGPVLSKEQVQG